jgi:membrane protease YdiL (CAAX protease family)
MLLVACAAGIFRTQWFALYALLPSGDRALLMQAARPIPNQRGNWRDFLVLTALGLAVDLRWFEGAWPAHLAIFNKILLLDAGIYGFVLIRRLDGTGFALRLRGKDLGIGLREAAFYTPIALALGLALGFLHFTQSLAGIWAIAGAWLFTFFFVAVPEELFFRGWLQNLLEKRMGRYGALFADCLPVRPGSLQQAHRELSTGATYCWLRWPASFTAAHGVPSAGWEHRPLRTPRSTPSGRYGCDSIACEAHACAAVGQVGPIRRACCERPARES